MSTRTHEIPREVMLQEIKTAKERLGKEMVILGHHYQRDEVIQFADFRGDSLRLARLAAETDARFILFCGVHFMAETADILTAPEQTVILPDLKAGCSMADMVNRDELEEAWELLIDTYGEPPFPITYVNSSAEVKAFVGQHGGMTVTSSNAERIMAYALRERKRIFFLPDQHLGRNTAYRLGIPLEAMKVYNPREMRIEGGEAREDTKVILWKGHCSVHQRFDPVHVRKMREEHPGIRVIVHPECKFETVQAADESGSTEYIIKAIERAPAGTKWAIGTEHNLVYRLAKEHPEQEIYSLNPIVCACYTMNRIDLPHLHASVMNVLNGEKKNVIRVPEETASWAKVAIERMLRLG
ncbi:quinolinate synthetase [[Clostridium] ultunense Esp]|nr:quinolinate synthetase [[Clostridium] ultunense Esp]